MIRYHILIALLVTIALLSAPESARTQDIQAIKSGVVRIVNPELKAQGTGFIVRISPDQSRVSIITASHVVKEAEYCDVYFLGERNVALKGKVTEPEEDETKGLALLEVVGKKGQFSDVEALEIGESLNFKGGEKVEVFGFPEGALSCTVVPGGIARFEKRTLVISGDVLEGNSGGPVVYNGKVVGLITAIRKLAYAEQGESIRQYLLGLGISVSIKRPASSPQPKATPVPADEFCKAVHTLVDAALTGFYDIIEGAGSGGQFRATIIVPGSKQTGYIRPRDQVYYLMASSVKNEEVESEYYKLVSKLRKCFADWEKKETPANKISGSRYYIISKGEMMPEIEVSSSTNHGTAYLWLEVNAPKKLPN